MSPPHSEMLMSDFSLDFAPRFSLTDTCAPLLAIRTFSLPIPPGAFSKGNVPYSFLGPFSPPDLDFSGAVAGFF